MQIRRNRVGKVEGQISILYTGEGFTERSDCRRKAWLFLNSELSNGARISAVIWAEEVASCTHRSIAIHKLLRYKHVLLYADIRMGKFYPI